jgi:hypothetical protein
MFQPHVKDTFGRSNLKNMRFADSVDEAVSMIQGIYTELLFDDD